jgi:hypothetical protein
MNRVRVIKFFTLILAFGFSGMFFSSCKVDMQDGIVVFTQVSGKMQDINSAMADSSTQNIVARIVALNLKKADQQPVVLTEGFYSARAPQISSDGKRVVCTAREKKDDKWQIWEITLKNMKQRSVTSLPDNCIDPAYLPDGRIIFSKQTLNSDLNGANAIFSCNPDGSDLRQSTYNPHAYRSLTVLQDGRVMAISRQLVSDEREEAFMVLRPDGTKNELFYKGTEGSSLISGVRETSDGKILFIESDGQNHNVGNVISINYSEPFHSYKNLTSGMGGDFKSVYPVKSGKYLVSYRKSGSEHYGLFEFDPASRSLSQSIYTAKDFDVAEVVTSWKPGTPRKLPSEVDMGVKTGLILCQDINFHGMSSAEASSMPKAYKIHIVGRDSILGEVDVEKDGSFYLKVIADTPFRIETVDDKGRILGGSCDWVYLRPNERRGCVGCHESREIVPDNKVSLAVKNAPVSVPVHMNKVVEKKVSLE